MIASMDSSCGIEVYLQGNDTGNMANLNVEGKLVRAGILQNELPIQGRLTLSVGRTYKQSIAGEWIKPGDRHLKVILALHDYKVLLRTGQYKGNWQKDNASPAALLIYSCHRMPDKLTEALELEKLFTR